MERQKRCDWGERRRSAWLGSNWFRNLGMMMNRAGGEIKIWVVLSQSLPSEIASRLAFAFGARVRGVRGVGKVYNL